MRELSFSKKWDKLNDNEFTTFRVPRKDKDWEKQELVRIVYHARCNDRKVLGTAMIIEKSPMTIGFIGQDEAIKDGFPEGRVEMWRFMIKSHKGIQMSDPINKLTLRWYFHEGQ